MAKLSEVGLAYAAEKLSHWSVQWPWLGDIVLGRDPRVQRVAWSHVPARKVLEYNEPWVRVDGDPTGPWLPWPARYRWVAVVNFAPKQASAVDKDLPVTLAWKTGDAVMATILTPEESTLLRIRKLYRMRVGRAAAEFAIGQTDPEGLLILHGATKQSPASVEIMMLDKLSHDAVMY